MSEEWLTTQQAADLSGYHMVYVRNLVRDGQIEGRKWGQAWQVSKTSLLTYMEAAKISKDNRRGPK